MFLFQLKEWRKAAFLADWIICIMKSLNVLKTESEFEDVRKFTGGHFCVILKLFSIIDWSTSACVI